MADALMTPEEVATYLRKSRSWVYGACERGQLPHSRVGRALRFSREKLEQWLAEQAPKPTPPADLKERG